MRTVKAVLWMGGARRCDTVRVSCTLGGFSGKSFTECAVQSFVLCSQSCAAITTVSLRTVLSSLRNSVPSN